MKRMVYIILPLLSKGVLPGAWHHGLVVAKLFLGVFFSLIADPGTILLRYHSDWCRSVQSPRDQARSSKLSFLLNFLAMRWTRLRGVVGTMCRGLYQSWHSDVRDYLITSYQMI